jgi:hypothetical protein
MQETEDPALQELNRLVGSWSTEATHPALPGVVVRGTTSIEWLEGQRFLIVRSRNDHPDFPDAISILGFTDVDRVGPDADESTASGGSRLCMHYFDSRGVFRVYEASVDAESWRLWRNALGFSQRFAGSFADDGDTIVGRWRLSRDDSHWDDDLQIVYRRQ